MEPAEKSCDTALLILDDFLLHAITDEREVKILPKTTEKQCERNVSTLSAPGENQPVGMILSRMTKPLATPA